MPVTLTQSAVTPDPGCAYELVSVLTGPVGGRLQEAPVTSLSPTTQCGARGYFRPYQAWLRDSAAVCVKGEHSARVCKVSVDTLPAPHT